LTTTTPSMTTASSTQTIRIFKLTGVIFFDYNGNGKQEKNEPPIPQVTVALNGANLTATNATGGYTIGDVTEGLHRLRVFPPKKFRYMCESDAEFRTVQASYEVLVRNDTRKDIGLMEGFLTLPFDSKTTVEIRGFYDHISSDSLGVVNYRGDTTYTADPTRKIGTDKGHHGIDFGAPAGSESFRGTPVRAAAPGILSLLSGEMPGGSLSVRINHGVDARLNEALNSKFMELHTACGHLDRFAPRIESAMKARSSIPIKRGEIIGYAGSTGSSWPHVHFRVMYNERGGQGRWKEIDAFAVLPEVIQAYEGKLYDPEVAHMNWWTVYNNPQPAGLSGNGDVSHDVCLRYQPANLQKGERPRLCKDATADYGPEESASWHACYAKLQPPALPFHVFSPLME